MIKSTSLAYAAGYFDGDGCFSLSKTSLPTRYKFKSVVLINSTSEENVKWFQNIFGGTISKRSNPKKPTHKSIYHFALGSEYIEPFYSIGNFLVEKREEFEIFRKFRNTTSLKEKLHYIDVLKRHKNESNLITTSIKDDLLSIRHTV